MTTAVYDSTSGWNATIINDSCTEEVVHVCMMTTCINVTTNATMFEISCNQLGIGLLLFVFSILALAAVLGNLVIIYVMVASKASKKSNGSVKCSLAVADLLQGAIAVPASVYTYVYFHFLQYTGESLTAAGLNFLVAYRVYIFVFILSNGLSLFSLVILSLDRFLAICYPLRYHAGKLMTRGRVYSFVAVAWVLCVVMGAVFEKFLADEFQDGVRKEYINLYIRAISIVFGTCYFITIILLAITVISSFKTIRSMQKLNVSLSAAVRDGADANRTNIELKFAKTVTLMVFFFTASVLPYVILKLSGIEASWIVELVFEYLLYTNSVWNVFIYSFRCKDFQSSMCRLRYTRALLQLFCRNKLAEWSVDDMHRSRMFTVQASSRLKHMTSIDGDGPNSPSCHTLASTDEHENIKLMQLK